MSLRTLLDGLEHHFEKGGKFARAYPAFEAIDTAFYTPSTVTGGAAHVRDALNLKRIMMTVWLAAFIPVFVGSWVVGYQANTALAAMTPDQLAAATDGIRYVFLSAVASYNPGSSWDNLIHGLSFFVPLYVVVFGTGIAFEIWFASKRGHEVNEGFFVTSILFTLTLPAGIPLWMAAMGVAFGVVVGKEVFGGTGKNFLNPALTGRAFLYFAYPVEMSGDRIWIAVDGVTQATPLGNAKIGDPLGIDWMSAFIGNMPGSFGETSTLAILIAACILLITRIASWRVTAGCVVGAVLTTLMFNSIESTNPMFAMPFWWHFVLGGFAFGAVFMATDPVSAAMTDTGRWAYGIFIGFMCIVIRVANPAFPEGMMLAILFGNLMAPLFDYFVIQSNIKRRLARG